MTETLGDPTAVGYFDYDSVVPSQISGGRLPFGEIVYIDNVEAYSKTIVRELGKLSMSFVWATEREPEDLEEFFERVPTLAGFPQLELRRNKRGVDLVLDKAAAIKNDQRENPRPFIFVTPERDDEIITQVKKILPATLHQLILTNPNAGINLRSLGIIQEFDRLYANVDQPQD